MIDYNFQGLFTSFTPNSTQARLCQSMEEDTLATRVYNIALPVLHLYQPVSEYINASSLVFAFSSLFFKICCDLKNHDDKTLYQDLYVVMKLTGTLAMAILLPKIYSFSLNISALKFHISECHRHRLEENYSQVAHELLRIAQSLATIGFQFYPSVGMLAISLLIQAVKDIELSLKEFNNGRIMEGMANLMFAAVRINSALPNVQNAIKDYKAKHDIDEDLANLYTEIDQIYTYMSKKITLKEKVEIDPR